MAKKSAEKAAFVCSEGTFAPVVMMMGLSGAPAKFQGVMMKVRERAGGKQVQPYSDDLITAADDLQEQLDQIHNVLEALQQAGLTVRLSKCRFSMKTVQFLGFRISKNGIQPGTKKLEAVEKFARPTDVHEVIRFLGLTRFV